MKLEYRYSEESAWRGETALQLAGVRDLKRRAAKPDDGNCLRGERNEVLLGPCQSRSAPLEVGFRSALNLIFSSQKGTSFMMVVMIWVSLPPFF